VKRNSLLPAIALAVLACDPSVRLDKYAVGVSTSRATCVASLKDYTERPPATYERVVILRARNGSSAQQLDAIKTEAALEGATGILLGRPQDSAGLPAANPGETWGSALLVTADSGLVHSACDSH
jgi:hypothetical protein